jgi:RimJ/RimL family protein N-acetyltransferase
VTTPDDWLVKPTIVGERVRLRPFGEGDAERMHACLDVEAIRLTGSAHTTEEAERMAAEPLDDLVRDWYASRNDQDDRLDLVVEDLAGRFAGEVVLNEWRPDDSCANFRILLGPDGRGRGLGTEATRLVLQHAFGMLGLHRVELGYFSSNPRAGAAYLAAGFRVEGRRREAFRFDGEWHDEVLMAALATEWP